MTTFLLIILGLFFQLFSPSSALAQTQAWENINSQCVSGGIATLIGFECIFANLLRVIVPLAVFAAFITIVIGGFQYLISAGDPKQTQKAQAIITGGIVGLLVIVIVYFVFNLLGVITGLDFFNFSLSSSG